MKDGSYKVCSAPTIDEADLRAIVRLLGETATLPVGDLFAKRRYVLDGLCDFVGANEWRWALFPNASGVPEACNSLSMLPQTGVRRAFTGVFPPLPEDAEGRALQPLSPEHLPALSPSERVIVSCKSLDSGTPSRIALYRKGKKPYTSREVQMALLTIEAVPWLHWGEWPPRKPAMATKPLSPRLQLVLKLLLKGSSRKDIAERIGISPGTVNGYTKELYRHFGVKSHAYLMRISIPNDSASAVR